MSNNPTVVVRNLRKTFYLTRSGSEIGLSKRKNRNAVEALKGVNLVTYTGESVGVLGRNGSGKSTLLNLIAGNEVPTKGSILVSAKPALLSVSAALQGNLSGFDNVRLGLLAKGMSPREVSNTQDSVADWADIGSAIHRPLKTYSSGMKARLKFAIATAVRPEILLVDEALATGDAAFAERAKARMDQFLESLGTVFIVSHSAATVKKHCYRAIWLHEGTILADGSVDEVAPVYEEWTKLSARGKTEEAQRLIEYQRREFEPPQIILESEAAALLDDIRAF